MIPCNFGCSRTIHFCPLFPQCHVSYLINNFAEPGRKQVKTEVDYGLCDDDEQQQVHSIHRRSGTTVLRNEHVRALLSDQVILDNYHILDNYNI